jgi:YCII-related domain
MLERSRGFGGCHDLVEIFLGLDLNLWRLGPSMDHSFHCLNARSQRAQSDGKALITDGPYLETKEHIGGFWVLEAADLDEPPA